MSGTTSGILIILMNKADKNFYPPPHHLLPPARPLAPWSLHYCSRSSWKLTTAIERLSGKREMGVGSGLQLLIRSSGHLIMVLCLRFSYTSFKNEGMKRREQRGEKRIGACWFVGEQKDFLCVTCQNTTNMEEWGFLDGLVLFYSFWAKILRKYFCTYPDFPNSGYWIQAAAGGPALMATSVPDLSWNKAPGASRDAFGHLTT